MRNQISRDKRSAMGLKVLFILFLALTACSDGGSGKKANKLAPVPCEPELRLCVDDKIVHHLLESQTTNGIVLQIVPAGALTVDERSMVEQTRERDPGLALQLENTFRSSEKASKLRIFTTATGGGPLELPQDLKNIYLRNGCAASGKVCVGQTFKYTFQYWFQKHPAVVNFQVVGVHPTNGTVLGTFMAWDRYFVKSVPATMLY